MSRAKPNRPKECIFVGKGGLKLAFAIEHFQIFVKDRIAIDFGSHQGGFVDCLLQNGVSKVYAVDTCYGTLDWKLRNNEKVIVQERINAMHWKSPEKVDIVTIDVGWTPQKYIIPNAVQVLKDGGIILSLLKPQYEVKGKKKGILDQNELQKVIEKTFQWLKTQFEQADYVISPYKGSGGNIEAWFCLSAPLR